MENFFDLIYKIGEFIIFCLVNLFYSLVILLPFFVINPLLERPMSTYILIFVPLTGLIGFSIERLVVAINEVFNRDKPYFKAFFNKVRDKFLHKYLLYVIEISIFYYMLVIFLQASKFGLFYKIIKFIFIFLYGNIIFYTLMQTSLREYVGFTRTIKNAIVLTYRYLILSILNGLAIFIFISLIGKNIIFFLVFLFIMAGFINFCHRIMFYEKGGNFER